MGQHFSDRSSRNWDGSPETEFDTRFHDLRESGYTGPIDQDGYPVTRGEDARILRDMAARRGEDTSWWTGPDTDPADWARVDHGAGSRGRAVTVLALVAVVVVVLAVTHLPGW